MALQETYVFIKKDLDTILSAFPETGRLDSGAGYRIGLFHGTTHEDARYGILFEDDDAPGWVQFQHEKGNDVDAIAAALKELGTKPDEVHSMTDWNDVPLIDLDGIRNRLKTKATGRRKAASK